MLDSPNSCVLFPNSISLEPVGSVHFRAPAGPSRAGAVERGAARAAIAKIAKNGPYRVQFDPLPLHIFEKKK